MFIIAGARHFDQLRHSATSQAFLTGAGAIGAIRGAAVPLGLAINNTWQLGILGLAATSLAERRNAVVPTVLLALAGALATQLGAPLGN